MEGFDLYRDIAQRTGGDIYVGVVGPVRTGKSTFIKRFMDLMVLPNIEDELYVRAPLTSCRKAGPAHHNDYAAQIRAQ